MSSADAWWTSAVAGAGSGIIAKSVIAPVDRVKLLLQLQRVSAQIAPSARYTGVVDCVRRVYLEQGALSFWRGNSANVVRYAPQQAINFVAKDAFGDVFVGDARPGEHRFVLGHFAAGGAAGAACLTLLYPLDFARTRLGVDVGTSAAQRQYTSLYGCLVGTVKAEGVRSVYRGFKTALVGVVVFRALFLGGHDVSKAMAFPDQGAQKAKPPLWKRFLVAQVVTTSAGFVAYPLDSVRRRLMMQAGVANPEYTCGMECARYLWRTEGYRGFYRGYAANILRGAGGALLLVLYDEIKAFTAER